MQLRCSVSSDYYSCLTPEEAVKAYLDAGFSCMELGQEHSKNLLARGCDPEKIGREFAHFAGELGLTIPQGHLNLDMEITEPADLDRLKTELDLYQGLGVKAAVLHAIGREDAPYEKQLELRSKALRELLAHIRGRDITICLENLFSKPMLRTADTLMELIDAAGGGEQLGFCLDIGHLHRVRSHGLTEQTIRSFVHKAGKRLKALHVHDNHGQLDDHLFPFTEKGLDWKEFMQALEEIYYQGLFNMEIHTESHSAPMAVKAMKLRYARTLCDYLLSDEFIRS